MANKTILILPGDGIGPEVTRQGVRVLEWLDRNKIGSFTLHEELIGGAAFDAYGVPLADATLSAARASDAILLGAVGGPKWDSLPYDVRPERGLLRLRKELDLFANLRSAVTFDPLVGASTLKPEVVRGIDMLIVRELTGGVYFGTPRGIFEERGGGRRGVNTHAYTTEEIVRLGRVAFDVAQKRGKKVVSVDKSNVMEAGMLWREEIQRLHDTDYPHIALTHMYADNCAMQLVRNPRQFDVMVTDNLFGDVLSDCAAMCTGSLGMLPSASLGAPDARGAPKGLYEPIHGSAPDIAGKQLANPCASILSVAMMLRYSLGQEEAAGLVEGAVREALSRGDRTADIFQAGTKRVSTTAMGDSILAELERAIG